jgi:hypothetical protein
MSCIPCLLPNKFLFINENPEHLKYRNSWVQLVQKNLIFLIKLVHLVHDVLLESSHQVLKGRCSIEIFLLKSLLLVRLAWHIRIVNTRQVFSILDFVNSIHKVFFLFSFWILVLLKIWLWSPKTKVVGVECIETCDWDVICHGLYSILVMPFELFVHVVHFDLSTHVDLVYNLGSLDLPGITFLQPLSWNLIDLTSLSHILLKEAILVP